MLLQAIFVLLMLGWVFVPVYIASGVSVECILVVYIRAINVFLSQVYTLPEYLSKRFGEQRIRVYLAVLGLIMSIFTKIAVRLTTGQL